MKVHKAFFILLIQCISCTCAYSISSLKEKLYLGGMIPSIFPEEESGSFMGLEFGFITLAGTDDPYDFTS